MTKKVSIISPCYNGEKYINRFLDSVLVQSFSNIELIVINDGSTDKTEQIILSYSDRLREKGIDLIYKKQENKGQSEAINMGLEVFSGEYMTWIDSDDILPFNAIEKKVMYMDEHPDVGLLISKIKVVDFETLKEKATQERKPPLGEDRLFFDLIDGKNVFYTPGGYMVRSSVFRAVMPTPLKIESPRETGQNFQLLLPISYKAKIGYLDEYLYFYCIRKDSHSHLKHNFEEMMRINNVVAKQMLENIIISMDMTENDKILSLKHIDERILRFNISILLMYGRKDNLDLYEQQAKDMQILNLELKKQLLMIKYPKARCVWNLVSKLRRIIRF